MENKNFETIAVRSQIARTENKEHSVPLYLTSGFVFDDAVRWRTARYDRWEISGGHLIHDGQDGNARIPLTEIDHAFRRLGSNVVVQLTSGQRIVLRYLPYPAEAADQINAAKPT